VTDYRQIRAALHRANDGIRAAPKAIAEQPMVWASSRLLRDRCIRIEPTSGRTAGSRADQPARFRSPSRWDVGAPRWYYTCSPPTRFRDLLQDQAHRS
jgi:hypothetical protein